MILEGGKTSNDSSYFNIQTHMFQCSGVPGSLKGIGKLHLNTSRVSDLSASDPHIVIVYTQTVSAVNSWIS